MKPQVQSVSLKWPHWVLFGVVCGSTFLTATASLQQLQLPVTTPEQSAFFESKIRPLFANNCLPCHGKTTQMAGLRLDTLAGIQKGGESGPVLIPGNLEKSLLIQVVHYSGPIKMPKAGKLKPVEITDLEAWISMGAPWPKAGAEPKDEKAILWSLQPVKKPSVPIVRETDYNAIDAFVAAKLASKKQKFSPPADRRTLLRRVTYDLIGLPPTAAETDVFLADKSPNAYDKVVTRLLGSTRYGERWARLWLDVARYADTKGYVFEEDRTYPNAYTYRDWVINAFNQDLPYDQFITQQLAADRLPEVQNGDDKRPLAALGFLTVGRRFLNSTPDIIDDRIDVTMRGFQGFTVACARCHDHKFDPIPTQDYYSLYAVFASSLEAEIPISEKSVREPWDRFQQRYLEIEKSAQELALAQVKKLRQIPDPAKNLTDEVRANLQGLRDGQPPMGEVLTKLRKAFEPAENERLARLENDLTQLKNSAPARPEFAMAMNDRPNPGDGVVFKRGNPGNHGGPAPRRFLLALSKPGAERDHWTSGSGRLELAKSIASKENPLTARVFVNRIWQHHFGAGLVRTPSDFGHQGEKPTHPELLDYLAATFMENGWSIKKLHRLIVTSATYRQSSSVTPAAYNADPENRLLGRMNRRRLDMEQMRDSLMVASGDLSIDQTGGKSVDLWAQPFTTRRAVYGFIERQNLPGIFRTFDFASPDSTNPRRFLTTVPQQALFFMNSPFSVEQARSVAERADIKNSEDDAQRVRKLYRLLFSRLPDANELAVGLAYLKEGALAHVPSPAGLWQYGYGAFDSNKQRLASFTPFAHYAEDNYRVGSAFPDPSLGFLILKAQGGHPGRDAAHCVVRRWTAPATMTVRIEGVLGHGQSEGDGVRGRVVSSRSGSLGEWVVFNRSTKTDIGSVSVQKGETLDFVVDCIGSDGFDAFGWSPNIRSADGKESWSAMANFGPPPPPPLSRLTLYAQALMMTNEFLFVD